MGEGFIFTQRVSFLPALMGGGNSKKFHTVGGMLPTGGKPAVPIFCFNLLLQLFTSFKISMK